MYNTTDNDEKEMKTNEIYQTTIEETMGKKGLYKCVQPKYKN